MSKRHPLVVGLIACTLASACAARSRMGDMVVKQSGQLPCFALEDTTETRSHQPKLFSIEVYERAARSGEPIWRFNMDLSGPGMPFPPDQCVSYGKAPAAAIEQSAAKALTTGTVYLITASASVDDPGSPTQGYQAEFCLTTTQGGPTKVLQVPWDEQRGQWRRDLCGASGNGDTP